MKTDANFFDEPTVIEIDAWLVGDNLYTSLDVELRLAVTARRIGDLSNDFMTPA
jgi:hypothetical protein